MKGKKYNYELRQIDAWGNKKEGYEWNTSYNIKNMRIVAGREKERLLQETILKHHRRQFKVVWDGSIYELQCRKTDEPLFALLPLDY